MPAELVFWIAVFIPLYAFAGLPAGAAWPGLAIRREVRKAPIRPLVSLLIPAYNEARVIARKIENSLALDYPRIGSKSWSSPTDRRMKPSTSRGRRAGSGCWRSRRIAAKWRR
jgi:cellulose synthase/poly-beta-1,6-N-acetylglucosamine synthase-like glycosyltransferase